MYQNDEEHPLINKEDAPTSSSSSSSFFSSTNRFRYAAVFFLGMVAVVFLVRIDANGAVVLHPSVLALSKKTKSSSSKDEGTTMAKEFFESWGTNSRLAPMQYHTFAKNIGYFKTFLAKYQLLDDRELPDGYEFPNSTVNLAP